MNKYILLFISLFAINNAKSQHKTIAENSLIAKLMIDPKMVPAEKVASRIITVWDSLNVEDNNNYAFTKISKLKLVLLTQVPYAPPCEQKVQSECVPVLLPNPISAVPP